MESHSFFSLRFFFFEPPVHTLAMRVVCRICPLMLAVEVVERCTILRLVTAHSNLSFWIFRDLIRSEHLSLTSHGGRNNTTQ